MRGNQPQEDCSSCKSEGLVCNIIHGCMVASHNCNCPFWKCSIILLCFSYKSLIFTRAIQCISVFSCKVCFREASDNFKLRGPRISILNHLKMLNITSLTRQSIDLIARRLAPESFYRGNPARPINGHQFVSNLRMKKH